MTKADIVRLIAQGTGLTQTDTAVVVEQFISAVTEALARGEHIEIRGFGTLKAVQRAPRTGRNPRTGAEVRIGSRRAPAFKASKELRTRIDDRHARAAASDTAAKQPGDKKNALWPEEKAA